MQNSKNEIYQIVYVSHAVGTIQDIELHKILAAASRENQRKGLTGVLIMRGTYFIQLLEGRKAEVLDTFETIKHDRRHKNVKVLAEGASDARLFPQWSMGSIGEQSLLKSNPKVLSTLDSLTTNKGDLKQVVLTMLKTFATLK